MADLALLLNLLRDTFATQKDARRWWRSPHPALGGAAPSAAAKTEQGQGQVRNILIALKYGGVL